jgi:hypothetical protein
MIMTVGNSFSPDVVNAVVGDEIHLMIAATHTFTQVDQATWNANGNTPNGGHDFGSGEHTFTLNTPGTIYYVCQPHASMGMKGRIIVSDATGVDEHASTVAGTLSPNPANTVVRVTIEGLSRATRIELHDMKGTLVFSGFTAADGSLDVSALPIGTYVCLVYDRAGEAVLRRSLAIQH